MPLRIGITLGDVTGIGPEVALKAVASEAAHDEAHYVFIGDARHLRQLNECLRLNLPLADYAGGAREFASGAATASLVNQLSPSPRFTILDSDNEPLPTNLAPGAPEAARAAVRWL